MQTPGWSSNGAVQVPWSTPRPPSHPSAATPCLHCGSCENLGNGRKTSVTLRQVEQESFLAPTTAAGVPCCGAAHCVNNLDLTSSGGRGFSAGGERGFSTGGGSGFSTGGEE